jgi:hypothetical protein
MLHRFRRALFALFLSAAGPAFADPITIALWELPVAFPVGSGLTPTGNTYLPPSGDGYAAGTPNAGVLAGDVGAILTVFHLSPNAQYTSPTGNGSLYSFSSNNWQPGDYYEIILPTTGWTNLTFSWDQARNAYGPSDFALQYSTDGMLFEELLAYTVYLSAGPRATGTWWTSTTYNELYTTTFQLPEAASDQPALYLRLVDISGAASLASGTNRIDNILVTGTEADGGSTMFVSLAFIPEPVSAPPSGLMFGMGIAGLAGVAMLRQRRRPPAIAGRTRTA